MIIKGDKTEYGRFIEIKGFNARYFTFVAKAVSDDETRFFMNFIYCEDDKLISTDGRRVHILDLSNNPYLGLFENGKFYRHLKSSKTVTWLAELKDGPGGEFPNWKRVVPNIKEMNLSVEIVSTSMNKSFNEYSRLIKSLSPVDGVNFNHIKDLVADESWKVYTQGKRKVIVLVSPNGATAAIMPTRLED
jgi:hypothetical protein